MKIEEKYITNAVLELFNKNSIIHKYEYQYCSKFLDLYLYNKETQQYIAIESKISSISRAFNQAELYRSVANFVYVAVFKNKSNKTAIKLAEETGIGLIFVMLNNEDFQAEIYIPAKLSSIYNEEITNHYWSKNKMEQIYG